MTDYSSNSNKNVAGKFDSHFGQPVSGERRVVTILFSDIKGSTSMAEGLDPEEWAEIINEAFHYLITPIQRYEGTVANLMGDAVLAFFGAPSAHEDDPQRAILAGLAILEGITPFCEKIKREYNLDFHVRVGINTGPVVVGQIGAGQVMEYTALGDAVNIAARMEQTAEPGTVQIAEDTYRLVNPLFKFESLGGIEVKGKSQPVNAFRALSFKDVPGRLRGIEGLSSPVVGRDREIALLNEVLESNKLGRGGIVFLIGEAGLGKSRLIDEMRSVWTKNTNEGQSWVESRGVSYDSDRPYSLFIHHVRNLLGVGADDSPSVVREKIAAYTDAWDERQRETVSQAVEVLLAVHEETELSPQMAEALKHELNESQIKSWRKTASLAPTVIVFDDLHWADSASVGLLAQLFQLTDEVPLLLVCAMRPDRKSHAWELTQIADRDFPHRYTPIELEPLDENYSDALVNNLLTIADLPENVRHMILEKTEGNPFFLEEVIRTLIDEGFLVRDEINSSWRSNGRVDEIDLPVNLEALLMSRIDRLDQDIRSTLQMASVIGRSFFYRVLERISDSVNDLKSHLNSLQRVELIHEAARVPELEYLFQHELTRDAAYNTILRRQRKEFHRRVGEAIEELFPDQIEAEAHLLGKHFRDAGEKEKAICYFIMAGDRAANLYANKEAAGYYQEALRILDKETASSEQLIPLYKKLGRVYEVSTQINQALELYQELENLGGKRDKGELRLAGLVSRTTLFSTPTTIADPVHGLALGKQAVELARELNNPRQEARALWNILLAKSNINTESLSEAIEDGELALKIAHQHNLEEELGYIQHDLARAYIESGRIQEGIKLAGEARENFSSRSNKPLLADNLIMSSDGYLRSGKLSQALELALEGKEVAKSTGSLWGMSYSHFSLAMLYFELGLWWQSAELLSQAINWVEQAHMFDNIVSIARAYTGLIYTLLGDLDHGIAESHQLEKLDSFFHQLYLARFYAFKQDTASIRKAFLSIKEHMDYVFKFPSPVPETSLFFIGDAALLLGENRWLLEFSTQVLSLLGKTKSHFLLPDAKRLKALALINSGKEWEGVELLSEAGRLAEIMGFVRAQLFILSAQLEIADKNEKHDKANNIIEKGRPIIETILEGLPTEELRQRFMNTTLAEKFLKNRQKI